MSSSPPSNIRPDQIKEVLKRLLKEKGLTYGDVAEALGCSLPTIKRILGPEELTLSRLLEICDLLELKLTELEQLVLGEQGKHTLEYTEEQEDFLAKNPAYLSYFALIHSGALPEEIAKEFNLTKRSSDLYVLRLEKLDLLRTDSKGRVRPRHREFPNFRKKGPLVRMQLKSIIEKCSGIVTRQIGRAFADETKNRIKPGVSMMSFNVPAELYERWTTKLTEVSREFDAQGTFESRHRPSVTNPTALICIMHTMIEPGSPEERNLKTTFAEIKNLDR